MTSTVKSTGRFRINASSEGFSRESSLSLKGDELQPVGVARRGLCVNASARERIISGSQRSNRSKISTTKTGNDSVEQRRKKTEVTE
jgi:hypothetical protein